LRRWQWLNPAVVCDRVGVAVMVVIKASGAAVFLAAVLVGLGILTSRIGFYYGAVGLAGAALIAVLLSAVRWRRRPTSYS
jgi:hypothetical protein